MISLKKSEKSPTPINNLTMNISHQDIVASCNIMHWKKIQISQKITNFKYVRSHKKSSTKNDSNFT